MASLYPAYQFPILQKAVVRMSSLAMYQAWELLLPDCWETADQCPENVYRSRQPYLSFWLISHSWRKCVLYSSQPRGWEVPSPRQQCLLHPDRWIVVRYLAYKLRLKHLSARAWSDLFNMQDKDGKEKRGLSYGAFLLFLFTLNAPFTCFSQLLRFGCGPWADTELCRRGRELFVVRGVSVRHPSPPQAPPHCPTHSALALPAVMGSWRVIFNRALHSIYEAEKFWAHEAQMKKKKKLETLSALFSPSFVIKDLWSFWCFLSRFCKAAFLVHICWQYF